VAIQDMASEERKAENRKLVAENLFKAQAAAPQQAETDAFQCGKCKQRRCMYYQVCSGLASTASRTC
jgi:transcription elongation factor S-II